MGSIVGREFYEFTSLEDEEKWGNEWEGVFIEVGVGFNSNIVCF